MENLFKDVRYGIVLVVRDTFVVEFVVRSKRDRFGHIHRRSGVTHNSSAIGLLYPGPLGDESRSDGSAALRVKKIFVLRAWFFVYQLDSVLSCCLS